MTKRTEVRTFELECLWKGRWEDYGRFVLQTDVGTIDRRFLVFLRARMFDIVSMLFSLPLPVRSPVGRSRGRQKFKGCRRVDDWDMEGRRVMMMRGSRIGYFWCTRGRIYTCDQAGLEEGRECFLQDIDCSSYEGGVEIRVRLHFGDKEDIPVRNSHSWSDTSSHFSSPFLLGSGYCSV